jgi:HAE1 family hydrophobic/amphiphilic exporter-1
VPQDDVEADSILAQQISRIDGVGLVNVAGAQKPAMRIQIDPRKVAALGLQIDAVRASIANSTVNSPKGSINGPQQNLTVYANDQVLDPTTWRDLVVGYHNGAAVRIKDIGSAEKGIENARSAPGPSPARPTSTRRSRADSRSF